MAKIKEGTYSPATDEWPEQLVRTYYVGLGATPVQRFEKDCAALATDGWRLVHVAIGLNGVVNGSAVVAIYQR